jgi:hypothetical protein
MKIMACPKYVIISWWEIRGRRGSWEPFWGKKNIAFDFFVLEFCKLI